VQQTHRTLVLVAVGDKVALWDEDMNRLFHGTLVAHSHDSESAIEGRRGSFTIRQRSGHLLRGHGTIRKA
jgi:hypothetical protein